MTKSPITTRHRERLKQTDARLYLTKTILDEMSDATGVIFKSMLVDSEANYLELAELEKTFNAIVVAKYAIEELRESMTVIRGHNYRIMQTRKHKKQWHALK